MLGAGLLDNPGWAIRQPLSGSHKTRDPCEPS